MESVYPTDWDPKFVAYCEKNNIGADCFDGLDEVPRYIRFNPRWITAEEGRRRKGVSSGLSGGVSRMSSAELGDLLAESVLKGLNDETTAQLRLQPPPPLNDQAEAPLLRRGGRSLIQVQLVDWLPGELHLYAVSPRWVSIAGCSLYKEGAVFVMDASSVCSVVALGLTSGDSVVDLCCAPGMKLALAADQVTSTTISGGEKIVRQQDGEEVVPLSCGSVVGVDISLNRLYATRSILKKYAVPSCSLYLCDSTKFTPPQPPTFTMPLEPTATSTTHSHSKTHQMGSTFNEAATNRHLFKMGKRLRGADGPSEAKLLAVPTLVYSTPTTTTTPSSLHSSPPPPPLGSRLFSKVLVDVECTHDGSIAHISQSVVNTKSGAREEEDGGRATAPQHEIRHLNAGGGPNTAAAESDDLHKLQLGLLKQGWRLLSPGGTLVYSTCSFSVGQNEAIVARFLTEEFSTNGKRSEAAIRDILHPDPLGVHNTAATNESSCSWQDKLRGMVSHHHPSSSGGQHGIDDKLLDLVSQRSVRMTPKAAATSFQYIAKLVKPEQSNSGECQGSGRGTSNSSPQ